MRGDAVRGDASSGRADAPDVLVEPSTEARAAVRSASFMWLALAFGLSSVTTTATMVHLIPLLLERGFTPAFAAGAAGAIGMLALPGRLVFTPLGTRWPRARVTASIFLLGALGLAALLATRSAVGVWTAVVLFGAGFGAVTPARAALVAELYGPAAYGEINGVLAFVLAVARAAGPVGASLLYELAGGYEMVLWLLVGFGVVSTLAVLRAREATPEPGARAGGSALRLGGIPRPSIHPSTREHPR